MSAETTAFLLLSVSGLFQAAFAIPIKHLRNPVYLGGASVAVPVGLFFARRSRTMALFVGRHAMWNWYLAGVMGLCAAATVVFYGLGGTMAGHPAPNVSFGIFMTFLVLGGNALGFATGEMRGNRSAVNTGLWMSSCGLVFAVWLLNAA